jgi:ATP-dependent protease Clp ATPase subunit
MLAELIGRFDDPLVYKELTRDDLRRILTESKNSFLLLKANRFLTQFNTELTWDDTYLDAIIEEAIKKKTGGRSLKKTIASSLKKCDRELLALRNQEGDKPRVLKLTADTVKNNRRFTIE